MFTLLDLCVSSLRRGHANLLCIVPILTDDPRRESDRTSHNCHVSLYINERGTPPGKEVEVHCDRASLAGSRTAKSEPYFAGSKTRRRRESAVSGKEEDCFCGGPLETFLTAQAECAHWDCSRASGPWLPWNGGKVKKVLRGFEPRSLDSESRVLTVTP